MAKISRGELLREIKHDVKRRREMHYSETVVFSWIKFVHRRIRRFKNSVTKNADDH